MTADDFEWAEYGFDKWYLMHKKYELAVAQIWNYEGWHIAIAGDTPSEYLQHVDSFDAAKAIAAIRAAQYIRDIPNEKRLSPRTTAVRPKKVPEGVFKVGARRPIR